MGESVLCNMTYWHFAVTGSLLCTESMTFGETAFFYCTNVFLMYSVIAACCCDYMKLSCFLQE